jgi:NADPH:quinone reductase-like Zn-dependent oxidoreductase
MSQKAAFYVAKAAPLEIKTTEIYKPGNGEVLIKNHYASSNPVDWKMQKFGYFVKDFPVILGNDVSGEIEEVGEGVTEFKKGDKVWAYLPLLSDMALKHGGYQEFSISTHTSVAKIPSTITLEEGATLGLTAATAALGLFQDLHIPRPTNPPTKTDEIILVWGGSSAVGGFAIQLAALAGYKVFTTTSPKHFEYVKKLGASEAFDYNDSEVVSKIKKAGGGHIKNVFDAISENGSIEKSVEILDQGKVLITLQEPEGLKKNGVEIVKTFVALIFNPQHDEFRSWFFKYFNEQLELKKILPTPPHVVAQGLENAQSLLDYHFKGVSAQKPLLKIL